MLSSFVSHKHGPSLLPCCSLSLLLFLCTPLICFYLRPAVPTTMIGVFTPPPDSLSNGWLPKAVEGRPFLSTALLIFHRETSPFFHSFALQSSPLVAPLFLLFLFLFLFFLLFFFCCILKFWFRSWIHVRREMQPLQTSHSLILF